MPSLQSWCTDTLGGIYAGSGTLRSGITIATIPAGSGFLFTSPVGGDLFEVDGDTGKVTINGVLDPIAMVLTGNQTDAAMASGSIYFTDGSASGFAPGTLTLKRSSSYYDLEAGTGGLANFTISSATVDARSTDKLIADGTYSVSDNAITDYDWLFTFSNQSGRTIRVQGAPNAAPTVTDSAAKISSVDGTSEFFTINSIAADAWGNIVVTLDVISTSGTDQATVNITDHGMVTLTGTGKSSVTFDITQENSCSHLPEWTLPSVTTGRSPVFAFSGGGEPFQVKLVAWGSSFRCYPGLVDVSWTELTKLTYPRFYDTGGVISGNIKNVPSTLYWLRSTGTTSTGLKGTLVLPEGFQYWGMAGSDAIGVDVGQLPDSITHFDHRGTGAKSYGFFEPSRTPSCTSFNLGGGSSIAVLKLHEISNSTTTLRMEANTLPVGNIRLPSTLTTFILNTPYTHGNVRYHRQAWPVGLKTFTINGKFLSPKELDDIFYDIADSGITGGTIQILKGYTPTAASATARSTVASNGWSVTIPSSDQMIFSGTQANAQHKNQSDSGSKINWMAGDFWAIGELTFTGTGPGGGGSTEGVLGQVTGTGSFSTNFLMRRSTGPWSLTMADNTTVEFTGITNPSRNVFYRFMLFFDASRKEATLTVNGERETVSVGTTLHNSDSTMVFGLLGSQGSSNVFEGTLEARVYNLTNSSSPTRFWRDPVRANDPIFKPMI